MNSPVQRRKVTRSFVLSLASLTTFFALAVLMATWGLVAFGLGVMPVTSEIPNFVTPIIIVLALAELFWMLWIIALALLRGRAEPPWLLALATGLLAYITWGGIGLIAGFTVSEAWLSVDAITLPVIWIISALLFWLLLARQVFTTRPRPLWPWEKREQRERESDQ